MSSNFTVCLCKTENSLRFLQLAYLMQIVRKSLIFWLLLVFCGSYAQYTEVINSNRPGFSESPYSVGSGVYQFESSWFLRKLRIDPVFSRPQSNGIDFLFRTSFLNERFELNTNLIYQRDQIAFKNIFTSSYFTSGLSRFTIAGKYLLYEQEYKDRSKEIRSWKKRHRFDWNRVIPSVAVYAGLNTDFVGDIHKVGSISPKLGVLLQNDFSRKFILVTNIFYDKLNTDLPEFSYIFTATYSFNDRWSTFAENQTTFTKLRVRSNLGSGLAFLYNKNLQFNSSLRFILDGKTPGFFTSIGISYRIDKHRDKLIKTDEYGSNIDEAISNEEKKGFFGRLFSKVTNVLKSEEKKQVRLKQSTIESIRKNTDNDSIKALKKLRTRPKRVRVKSIKKSMKRIEKKKEKERKRLEKQGKKEERRKRKRRGKEK